MKRWEKILGKEYPWDFHHPIYNAESICSNIDCTDCPVPHCCGTDPEKREEKLNQWAQEEI